jgi:hypothetical protein
LWCVDFDGTCTTHEYPNIGKDIGAVPVLKRLVEAGHKLIVFTMRSDTPEQDKRQHLQEAVKWFKDNGIQLYGSQVNPQQRHWTSSPKCYAQLYIDDAALGCPLTIDSEISDRPFVNWTEVEKQLEVMELLNKK